MGKLRVTQLVLIAGLVVVAGLLFVRDLRRAVGADIYESSTWKVCQLTGDEDRENPQHSTGEELNGHPSGVSGTDLGYPFERLDELFFLFGDTRETNPDLCDPAACGTNTQPKRPFSPSVQVTTQAEWDRLRRSRMGIDTIATAPATVDPNRCIPLRFLTDDPDEIGPKPHAVTVDGSYLGNWEIPTSGFSNGQIIFAFFSVRDTPPGCPFLTDGCTLLDEPPGGKSILAMSTNSGRTFTKLYDWSVSKFQWPVAVVAKAEGITGLPSYLTGDVVLVWGTGRVNSRFRQGYPYFAVAPLPFVGLKESWQYYAGARADGTPLWSPHEAQARVLPPFGQEILSLTGPGHYHKCLGEFSVRFSDDLGKWLMLYHCPENAGSGPKAGPGIYLRTSAAPWGPWSTPHLVFNGAAGYCHFMHAQQDFGCASSDPNPADESWRDKDDVSKNARGAEYAPYLLPSRYMTLDNDRLSLFFVMSTWNPYQAVLMKTQLRPVWWWKLISPTTKLASLAGLAFLIILGGSWSSLASKPRS